MVKNILFIVPPNIPFDQIVELDNKSPFNIKIRKEIPLGVLSIASYLKKHHKNLNIEIIDFNILISEFLEFDKFNTFKELEQIIFKNLPTYNIDKQWIIGISAIFNTTYCYLEPLSRVCKKLYKKSFLFSGGGLPSNVYDIVLSKCLEIDAICIGEGEIPILEFLEASDREAYLKTSNCWVTREKLSNNFKKEFKFIENLDEIPPLDFSLIPYKKYSNHIHNQNNKPIIAIPLMFSRGCPFNCCFCASHTIHGKKIRYNSIERIKYDVKRMVNEFKINTITIWDDNFFVDKSKAIELLKFFTELNLMIEFVNGLPVYRIDDDISKSLKNAGVSVVTLAIESGNQRILRDVIHKPLKLEMVEKAIKYLRKYNMYIKGMFVIGLPGETIKDIEITMDFIHKTEFNWVDIFIASPIAGSELYNICKDNNYIVGEIDNFNFCKGNIETPEFKPEQIQEIQLLNVLRKDFVENYDMLHGNYEVALKNFEYVINSNPDNPFAFYYAALASRNLKNYLKYNLYKSQYELLIDKNNSWNKYITKFSLSVL